VNPEAARIALTALAQRGGYGPREVELFRELAAYFRGVVEFPEAALEGLTGEEYVRSVLRVVFRGVSPG